MRSNKSYYRENRNKLLNRQKKRNAERKNDIRSYMESYYKQNRTGLLKRQKEYYKRNVNYYREYMKTYHKNRSKS